MLNLHLPNEILNTAETMSIQVTLLTCTVFHSIAILNNQL